MKLHISSLMKTSILTFVFRLSECKIENTKMSYFGTCPELQSMKVSFLNWNDSLKTLFVKTTLLAFQFSKDET